MIRLPSIKVPPVLYHGTSLLRWELVKRLGYLAKGESGYVFVTGDIDIAAGHGAGRYIRDIFNRKSRIKHYYELNPELRDCAVIGIKTQRLEKEFLWYRYDVEEIWFRYYDIIPVDSLFLFQTYPLPAGYDNPQITNSLISSGWLMNQDPSPTERGRTQWGSKVSI